MIASFRSRVLARLTLICFLAQLMPANAWTLSRQAPKAQRQPFRVLLNRAVLGGSAIRLPVTGLSPNRLYSFTVAADPALFFRPNEGRQLQVAVSDSSGVITRKTLHVGDPDLYVLVRPTAAGAGRVDITGPGTNGEKQPVTVKVVEWNVDAAAVRNIAYKPNGDWRSAAQMTVGETVFGTGDVTSYIPVVIDEATRYYDATQKSDALTAAARKDDGEDWLTFRYDGERPKLVYLQLDLPERDNIPPDVSLYMEKDGKLEVYEVGMDPVTPAHEVQALPGNKFTTRTITKGTYYVRVIASHPEWQLRTQLLDPPPYDSPNQAVQAGIDYLLGAGDSWHANIPRTGGRLNRVGNVHAETAQCIGCHPTQFTTRGALTAMRNGYEVQRREALKFLTERMANNPRPFYGHKGATWVRMISAPGNVTSRIADLVSTNEELTGERLSDIHTGAYNYLKLYYKGRSELPEDESNGNQPLISQYEVIYYAWKIFERQHQRAGDAEAQKYASLMLTLVGQNRHRNLIDLCWQTVAMAKMDRERFKDLILANCERILKEQRPDGQWSMQLDPKSQAVEFQTGHALYALAVAGYKPDHPQVQRTVQFLLKRQQPFGGWFDPLQTYENFRTPFRETQFAVMALSELYPSQTPRKMGWGDAAPPATLETTDTIKLLQELDDLWTRPNDAVMGQVIAALGSDEPMVRQMAATALGRVGDAKAVAPLVAALGDDTKLVQRAAAVALRALSGRGVGLEAIRTALGSPNPRVRAGAVRVFAYHTRALAQSAPLADTLLNLTSDAFVPVRMGAMQALWQWFWWSEDPAIKGRIVDTALAKMTQPEHAWVTRNAREALYNIADENVRYLYNNWIPALGDPVDREVAAAGQRAQDVLIAQRIAAALDSGSSQQRASVLRAVAEFHLRNVRTQNTRYPRIGNDVEQIRFSAEAAKVLEPAISRALKDPSPEARRYAAIAAFTLRDNGPLPVSLVLLGALGDPKPEVREAAAEFYKTIPVLLEGQNAQLVETVVSLLKSEYPKAQQASFDLLRSKDGRNLVQLAAVKQAVKEAVVSPKPANLPQALSVLEVFPDVHGDKAIREAVRKAVKEGSPEARKAALELALSSSRLSTDLEIDSAIDNYVEKAAAEGMKEMLEVARKNAATRGNVRVVGAISDALVGTDDPMRSTALEIVQKDAALQKAPAVHSALTELSQGSNARAAQIAQGIIGGKGGGSTQSAARLLDYEFFANRVMPVFSKKAGADGAACVSCHFNHNIFKVSPPDTDGRFTQEQIRETYRAALKVVNLENPERSLLLAKPTSTSATEGLVGVAAVAHGGGLRWSGPDDPSYRLILAWINGARQERQAVKPAPDDRKPPGAPPPP
jgi:HEAT repeat protein